MTEKQSQNKTGSHSRDTKARNVKRDTDSVTAVGRTTGKFPRIRRIFASPATIIVFTAVTIIAFSPFVSTVQTFDLPKEGEVAKETVIAPFTFDILKSPEELERERQKAMDQVLLVLDFNAGVQSRVRKKFLDLRNIIDSLSADRISDSIKLSIRSRLSKELPQNTIKSLLKRPYLLDDALFQAEQALENGICAVLLVPSESALQDLREKYNTPFERYLIYDKSYVTLQKDTSYTLTVKHQDIPVKEIALENIVNSLKIERMFDHEALNALYELLDTYMQPNVTVNGEATARARQRAALEVLPIKGKVIKDTEIMRKHQVVTREMIEKLSSLREALRKQYSIADHLKIIARYSGRSLLGIILLVFLALYIAKFRPEIVRSSRHMWALSCIIIVQMAIIRASMLLVPKLFKSAPELSAVVPEYLIPTAIAAILVTILFDLELSIVVGIFFSILYGIVMGFEHGMFLYALFGSLIAGYSYRNIRYRWDFFRAMPPVAGIYALFILIWHLVGSELYPLEIIQNIGLALINVITATFIAMMLSAIFENLFDICTDMTLVELADMNHPALKRLSIEAAGTYNHSVLVGNLAESAAARVGANPLLARVASYYHDIGKIDKSDYFVENHITDRNIHNKLSPHMSALIICSHVKEGIELARKYKLPRVIHDSIRQHHGTSMVSFFYDKAVEQDPHKQVKKENFRYPGPIPQTRENAIIMLADSVEAASRSLSTSSPKLLRELVKKIIRDKLNTGQLDQCKLTLRDLDRIVDGFMPVLQGIFHSRVEYPNKS
ncbi:MAG: HDIG domain-containing protein [Chitinivibrionales bacterium]|nr:HDIG domain-containing protein [Chitinivibrionales bacterium]